MAESHAQPQVYSPRSFLRERSFKVQLQLQRQLHVARKRAVLIVIKGVVEDGEDSLG